MSTHRVAIVPVAALGVLAAVLAAKLAGAAPGTGRSAYERVCGQCHGPEGSGDRGPPLVPMERDPNEVLEIAREGRGMMPPLSEKAISDQEVLQVVQYLKSLGK